MNLLWKEINQIFCKNHELIILMTNSEICTFQLDTDKYSSIFLEKIPLLEVLKPILQQADSDCLHYCIGNEMYICCLLIDLFIV